MELVFLEDDQPEFFPDPRNADDSGLVALSKSMGTKRIIAAYQQGIVRGAKQIARGDTAGGTANIIQAGLAGRTALGETKRQGSAAAQAGKDLNALRR